MNENPALASPGIKRGGVKAFFELSKSHLSLYIALSAVAGHVLARGLLELDSLVLGTWVFMLAGGCGVLNNIQDRKYDRRFSRTRNRVLARRAFPLEGAWILAFTLIGAAWAGLSLSYSSILPAILGALALICYNGLYTPMKKASLWAMVPGTACGMIPPAIGWAAVPGHLAAEDISGLLILTACLGFWQFPHYMLVDLKQGESGFKKIWPGRELRYQVLIWTSLYSLGMALLLIRSWIMNPWVFIPAFVMAVILPPSLAFFLFYPGFLRDENRAKRAFLIMNLSMFLFLSGIILDRL